MNRNNEQLVRHLRERYWYDAEQGVVRNRKNQVVKGAVNGRGYVVFDVLLKSGRAFMNLHQVVWVLQYGCMPTQIDHINGNPKDNRIENLREVSHSENNMNRLLAWKPNPSTGLPGVHKSNDSFEINVQGKQLKFRDKYEAFHALTMLGRMWNVECGMRNVECGMRNVE